MTTEQLVREALHAKAAQVRPEQVDMPFPVPARARRPVRTGLAMAVAAAVATVLIVTWAVAAHPAGTRQQAATSGGTGGVTTSVAGRIVSSPFDLPRGWMGMSVSVTDRYASWCVTNARPGSDRCDGLMVYQAAIGHTVPLDDALVPACDTASTTQKLVTAVTIDDRPASLVTQQCRRTDPTWLVWRTGDGAFAMVAEKGSAAADAAARILPGVHLPGTGPVPASETVSDAPVPSTLTCPTVSRDHSSRVTATTGTAGPTGRIAGTAGSAGQIASTAGSAAPVPSTGPAPADEGCPAG